MGPTTTKLLFIPLQVGFWSPFILVTFIPWVLVSPFLSLYGSTCIFLLSGFSIESSPIIKLTGVRDNPIRDPECHLHLLQIKPGFEFGVFISITQSPPYIPFYIYRSLNSGYQGVPIFWSFIHSIHWNQYPFSIMVPNQILSGDLWVTYFDDPCWECWCYLEQFLHLNVLVVCPCVELWCHVQ